MSALPTDVQTTFQRPRRGASQETNEDGKVVYHGEVVKNGKGTEVEISGAGKSATAARSTTRQNNRVPVYG